MSSPMRGFRRIALALGLSLGMGITAQAQAPAQKPAPEPVAPSSALPDLNRVQLDNGLTLADWVRVAGNREPQPSLATAAQAVAFIRRYGAYYELIDVVWRATRRPEFSPNLGAEPDPARLAMLADARRQLGDWPDLVYASARLKAQLGDATGTIADLRRWMALSPASAPRRTEIAELLLLAETDVPAVLTALTRALRIEVPPTLRRPLEPQLVPYAADIAKTVECVGAPATADAVVRQEYLSSANNQPVTGRVESSVRENGLYATRATFSFSTPPAADEVKESWSMQSVLGTLWQRDRTVQPTSLFDMRWIASNVQCSGPLLPARAGNTITASWTAEYTSRIEFPGSTTAPSFVRSLTQVNATFEILAGPLSLEQARQYVPELEIDAAAAAEWRLFAVRRTFDNTLRRTDGGSAGEQSNTRTSATVILVEGPNVLVAPFDDKFQKTPRRVRVEPAAAP